MNRSSDAQRILALSNVVLCLGAISWPTVTLLLTLATFVITYWVTPSAHLRRPNTMDVSICCFYFSRLLSFLCNHQTLYGTQLAIFSSVAVLIYLQRSLSSEFVEGQIFMVLTILALAVSSLDILAFYERLHAWQYYNFGDLPNFKVFVTPVTQNTSPSRVYILYLMGVLISTVSAAYWNLHRNSMLYHIALLTEGLSILCIAATFSRSLYIAAFLFVAVMVMAFQRGEALRRVHSLLCGQSFVMLGVTIVIYEMGIFRGCLSTVLMVALPSQVLSTKGRWASMLLSLHMTSASHLLGIGPGSLERAARLASATHVYGGQAYNLLIQVFVEQGILGVIGLVAIGIAFAFLYRTQSLVDGLYRGDPEPILLIGLTAIGIYCMFDASILSNFSALALMAYFLGCLSSKSKHLLAAGDTIKCDC